MKGSILNKKFSLSTSQETLNLNSLTNIELPKVNADTKNED